MVASLTDAVDRGFGSKVEVEMVDETILGVGEFELLSGG